MYKKPMILAANDLAEGVYAASGAADCWSGYAQSVQDWTGSHHVFELRLQHSTDVEHISTAVTVTLSFSQPLSNVYAENGWECSVNGSTVTVTRPSHANAYNSGDSVTFKVWATTGDEATTKALSCTVSGLSCTKTVNVQGGGADGN